jgi:type I restriction enzyme S subunit
MSFPSYKEYKDSDSDWMGRIPKSWVMCKVKHISPFFTGWTPPTGRSDFYVGENLWANISDLGPRTLNETSKKISDSAIKDAQIQITPKGSLLFSFKLSIGQVSFAGTDMYTNEAIASFPPNDLIDLGYAFYAYPIYLVENSSTNIYGAKLLNQELIRSAKIALPSISEQKSIANFLDHETVKIEELIAEQNKLITLLKEKRQAVISHAVTKGLNPAIKMKASGVEWLGEIPEHWKIYRVKKLLSVLTDYTANGSFASLAENVTYQTSGYSRLVRLTDLRENLDNEGLYVDENAHNFLKKSELVGGEVLIANVGAYAGFACLMPNVDMKATLGPNMYLMKFKESLLSNEYALLGLTSFHAQEQLKLSATSTAQPKLNKDDVKEIWLALPTQLSEQNQILNYVNGQKHAFDSLIEQAKLGIELLQERRSALISAAVTGQIDLRNFQSRESHDS